MGHLRALPSPWIVPNFTMVSILTENLRMTSAYCVSGLKVQLVKKFIYLPRVGSASKDWKHLSWVLVAVVTRDTVRMGERGPQGACWKAMSKPLQRYVTVARKPAANTLPAHHLYIWYHRTLEFAAAAKSLQSCPTLCNPIDGSPPGFPVPGILQARTLEWVAISFSNAGKWKVKVKFLSRVRLLATPWTAAHQAPPSMEFARQEYWSSLAPQIPTSLLTQEHLKTHIDIGKTLDNESYWNHSWIVKIAEEWDRDINEGGKYSLNLGLNLKS